MQAECDGSIRAVTFSLIDFPERTLLHFCPRQGAFLCDSATISRYLPEEDFLYENQKRLFCYIDVIPVSNFVSVQREPY
ncbi:hypothetical protein, partial [Enterobacter asburiae]|uniref:hypothetical protein n=2 Tax=Enterobacter asburiae TaxID=61645 RepID=UPI001F1521E9